MVSVEALNSYGVESAEVEVQEFRIAAHFKIGYSGTHALCACLAAARKMMARDA